MKKFPLSKVQIAVLVALLLLISSVILPELMESRITNCGGHPAGTLKSSIFSSQIQFRAGCYLDDNKNGVGEYGFIAQMSGEVATSKTKVGEVEFITGQLASAMAEDGTHKSGGYFFQVFLPDGQGGMITFNEYIKLSNKSRGANLREKYYVVFAWPENVEIHKRVYAMTQSGDLQSTSLLVVRDHALLRRDWREIFKLKNGSFEEIVTSGPSDEWPYYSK